MGRPIKKSFFANLNSPYQDHATSGTTGYGGEGVDSYGTIVAGSGWTSAPTVTVSTPDFAFDGATTATVQVHYQALSFATTANGSGYDVGNVLEVDTGTQTTKARAPVASILTVSAVKSAGGSGYNDGDQLTFSGAGWETPLILRVNRTGGGTGTPDDFTILQNGVRTAAYPTNPVAYTSRTGSGNGCTVNIGWGVYSFGAVSVAGDYTGFPSTSGAGTLTSVTPATGTGAKADITMGLLSVTVLTPGRGYTNAADAAISFTGSTGASATAVLTQAYDNGLKVSAFVTGGSSGVLGDILKQESSHRYLVKTAQGQSQCTLVTTSTLTAGTMNLIATDSLNSTYFVSKLTAHRANITQYADGGSGFEYGVTDVAGWTINSATTGTVSIANV
jgi:hypothetical protein